MIALFLIAKLKTTLISVFESIRKQKVFLQLTYVTFDKFV